jgi:putative endonuclease
MSLHYMQCLNRLSTWLVYRFRRRAIAGIIGGEVPVSSSGDEMFNGLKRRLSGRRSGQRAAHLELGARGEALARAYLKSNQGYEIIASNFRVPLGRSLGGQKLTGEIDIIAYDGPRLVFVEVKTRRSDDFIAPERAVDLRKQRQVARAARRYRRLMNVMSEAYRYDVVTVIVRPDGEQIELLRGYFDDHIFQRSRFFQE